MAAKFDKVLRSPDKLADPLGKAKAADPDEGGVADLEDEIKSLLQITSEQLSKFQEIDSLLGEEVEPPAAPKHKTPQRALSSRQVSSLESPSKQEHPPELDVERPHPQPSRPKPAAKAKPSAPTKQIKIESGFDENIGLEDEFLIWENSIDVKIANLHERRKQDRRKSTADAVVNSSTQTIAVAKFPELTVLIYEPIANVRNSIIELFEEYLITIIECADFDDFKFKINEICLPRQFTVAILGATADDEVNAERVEEVHAERAELPLIFLSNHDLSHMRRRTLHAGAHYFIEKPDTFSQNMVYLKRASKRFSDDLLLCVTGCHTRYKVVYEMLVNGG